jgi:hypothetical protein
MPGQLGDVDAVGAVRAAGDDAAQEDHLVSLLEDVHPVAADAVEGLPELGSSW